MNESFKLAIMKLEQLAMFLNLKVEEIYPYFIKQAMIESLYPLISTILFLIMVTVFIIFNKKQLKTEADSDITITIVSGILSIITLIVSLALFGEFGLQFLNPEYHAIKEIITLIR